MMLDDNNQILLSVMMLSYNAEKYIRQAIDSIMMQVVDFRYEVIIHDDASTDKSAKIIKEYEEKYPDIVKGIYQKENRYQKGIFIPGELYPLLRGKYVVYCDSDDYWLDEYKLQKQVDFLETHPDYVMCTHGFTFLYEDTQETLENHIYSCSKDIATELFIRWDGGKLPQIGTWMYRREMAMNRPDLFKVIAVKGVMSISDQPLAMYLALQGKIWYMNEVMSVWRRYNNSVSAEMIAKNGVAFCESKISFLEEAKKVFDDKYAVDFKKEIEKQRMLVHLYKKEYKLVARSSAFVEFPLSTRVRVWIGCISPKLSEFLRGVKHKNERKKSRK